MADDDRLREAIREISKDGKVTCERLLELADRTGSSPADVGRLCNETGIRIRACQLGCFQ